MKLSTRGTFWLGYLAFLTTTITGSFCLAGCDALTEPCDVVGTTGTEEELGSSTGALEEEEEVGSSTGGSSTGETPKEACVDEVDPAFFITVDEGLVPVISPNYCQSMHARCRISGVGTVDMQCDFKACDASATVTVTMPTEPGLTKIVFPNPCYGEE